MMCGLCAFFLRNLKFILPAAMVLFLWHEYGWLVFAVPAGLAAAYFVMKENKPPVRVVQRTQTIALPREHVTYRSELIRCLPCEREMRTITATNVLVVNGVEIPCCRMHLNTAYGKLQIERGPYRGR